MEGQCWALLAGDSGRTQGNGIELQGEGQVGGQGKASRLQRAVGLALCCWSSESIGTVIGVRWSCAEPAVGLNGPYGSLLTRDILWLWIALIKAVWQMGCYNRLSALVIPLCPAPAPLQLRWDGSIVVSSPSHRVHWDGLWCYTANLAMGKRTQRFTQPGGCQAN